MNSTPRYWPGSPSGCAPRCARGPGITGAGGPAQPADRDADDGVEPAGGGESVGAPERRGDPARVGEGDREGRRGVGACDRGEPGAEGQGRTVAVDPGIGP